MSYTKDKDYSIRIRISKQMRQEIDVINKYTGATLSNIVRMKLQEYINEHIELLDKHKDEITDID